MPIDPIRFNLATHTGATPKPAQAGEAAGGDAVQMATDKLQLAVRDVVRAGLEDEPPLPLASDYKPEPGRKFKLGLGTNLDETTRLELNASLKRGGTLKIELRKTL